MDKKVNMVILKVLVMVLLTLLINQDQFLIINTVTLMILIQKTTTYTMDQTIIKMELMTTLHLIINESHSNNQYVSSENGTVSNYDSNSRTYSND
jgi:hypothetical protein